MRYEKRRTRGGGAERKGNAHHENMLGSGGVTPPFLNSSLDGGDSSDSRPCSFTPEGRGELYQPERRQGGPRGVFLLGIEPLLFSPQHVSAPTQLI
jgi:hypothetical protein